MKRTILPHIRQVAFTVLVSAFLTASPALAQYSSLTQLPVSLPTLAEQSIGESIAMSDRYLVTGAIDASFIAPGKPVIAGAGAVVVHDAVTGAIIKRITAPVPQANASFGQSVAVNTTTLFVSSEEDTSPTSYGAVYAFDIATGKLLWKYTDTTTASIGSAVALSGSHLLVSNPGATSTGMVTGAGRILHLNAATGALITFYELPTPEPNDFLGGRLAVSGSLAVASSQLANSAGMGFTNVGKAMVIDLEERTVLGQLVDPTPESGAYFGTRVAISGNTVAVCRYGGDGAVMLYDARTLSLLRTIPGSAGVNPRSSVAICGDIVAAGNLAGRDVRLYDRLSGAPIGIIASPGASGSFGGALACNQNNLAIGADSWETPVVDTGAVFLARGLHQSLTGTTLRARTGDAAAAAGTATYASFLDTTLTVLGFPKWTATLKGAPTGKSKGIWWRNDASIRQGDSLGQGGTVGDVINMFSDPNWAHLRTKSGTAAIWLDDGDTLTRYFQEGVVFDASSLVAGKLLAVSGTVYPVVQVSAKVGVAGARASNDCVLSRWDTNTTTMVMMAREGNASPVAGRNYGQFAPRIATQAKVPVIAAALQGGTAADNAVLCFHNEGGGSGVIAQRGEPAPGCDGATFSQFLGENGVYSKAVGSTSRRDFVMRASLSGPVAQNEGIWSYYLNVNLPVSLVVRKGSIAPGLSATSKFTRFLRTFPAAGPKFSILIHAAVVGPGITAANDEGIWVYHGDGSTAELLLREGDEAPGCGGAKWGVIQRAAVNDDGRYAILASLTKSATGADQGLFTGNLSGTTAGKRRPHLALRKGMLVDRPGAEQIKSIGMSARCVNAQGIGDAASSRQIATSSMIFTVTYSDNVTELLTGWPDGDSL